MTNYGYFIFLTTPPLSPAPPPHSLRALATNSALRYLLNASRPSEGGEFFKTVVILQFPSTEGCRESGRVVW
jgi:hypothetical protein